MYIHIPNQIHVVYHSNKTGEYMHKKYTGNKDTCNRDTNALPIDN